MNKFIESLNSGRPQAGLFLSLASAYSAEVCAHAGFDWLLVESEHSPNTSQTLLQQSQVLTNHSANVVARPPCQEAWVIKQYLDLGFDTLLMPMVESAEQAEAIVMATRFPPYGIRGYAGMTSRASSFGEDERYFEDANRRVAVIAQIESTKGLEAMEEIAAVDGIDAIFFGPGDLAADMGCIGNSSATVVQEAIDEAIPKVLSLGKPCGLFALSLEDAAKRVNDGVSFMAIGVDLAILLFGAKNLSREFAERLVS